MADKYTTFERRLRQRVEEEIRVLPDGEAILRRNLWQRWFTCGGMGLLFSSAGIGLIMLSVGVPLFLFCGHEISPGDFKGLRTLPAAGPLFCITLVMTGIALIGAGQFWEALWKGRHPKKWCLLNLPVDDDTRFRLELAEIAGIGMILGVGWFALPTMMIVAHHANLPWTWGPLLLIPALLQGLVVAAAAVLVQGRMRSLFANIVGLSCLSATPVIYPALVAMPELDVLSMFGLLLQPTGWPSLLLLHGILNRQPFGVLWVVPIILLLAAAARRVRGPFRLREILLFPDGTQEAIPAPECVHLKGTLRIHRFPEQRPFLSAPESQPLPTLDWSRCDRVTAGFRRLLTRREEVLIETVQPDLKRWDRLLALAGLGLLLVPCSPLLLPGDADPVKDLRGCQLLAGAGLAAVVLLFTSGLGLPATFERRLTWAACELPIGFHELTCLSLKAWLCNVVCLITALMLLSGLMVVVLRLSSFEGLILFLKGLSVFIEMVLAGLLVVVNVNLSTCGPWYKRWPDLGSLFLLGFLVAYWFVMLVLDSWWIVLPVGFVVMLLQIASLRYALHYLHQPGVDWQTGR